jgi:hypothetical protein
VINKTTTTATSGEIVVDETLIRRWKLAEQEYRKNASRLGRLESVIRSREADNAIIEEKVKARDRARLLSTADADGNLTKLKAIVQASHQRILDLVREWEEYRLPLVNELKSKITARNALTKRELDLLNEISEAKEELAEIQARLEEAPINEDGTPVTQTKFVPGEGSQLRASVIARVLDSVKQVKKQTAEIERIVQEVKTLQKDVNVAAESVVTLEAETDDLIFGMAKEHPKGIQAYESFVEMIEKFDELLQTEHEAHLIDLEAKDKVAKCHSVAARVSVLKVESILLDLDKLKAENQLLKQQLSDGKQ